MANNLVIAYDEKTLKRYIVNTSGKTTLKVKPVQMHAQANALRSFSRLVRNSALSVRY